MGGVFFSGFPTLSLFSLVKLAITLFELQSHFGGNPLKFQVVCPQIGTAVLKGISLDRLSGKTVLRTLPPWWEHRSCGILGSFFSPVLIISTAYVQQYSSCI